MTIVKICGIKSLEDAYAAVEAGADYLGFNFHPKSPRYIDPAACAAITSELEAACPQVRRMGVFVNAPVQQVRHILQSCRLDLAQLHGNESPEIFAQLAPAAFKAFRGVPERLTGYERDVAPAALVDAALKDTYGGSGQTTDWEAAARLARRVPLMLAGGLTPENVAEAVRQVRPWGVDVASGVESAPGRKDPERMRAFIHAVREAEGQSQKAY